MSTFKQPPIMKFVKHPYEIHLTRTEVTQAVTLKIIEHSTGHQMNESKGATIEFTLTAAEARELAGELDPKKPHQPTSWPRDSGLPKP